MPPQLHKTLLKIEDERMICTGGRNQSKEKEGEEGQNGNKAGSMVSRGMQHLVEATVKIQTNITADSKLVELVFFLTTSVSFPEPRESYNILDFLI